MKETSKLIFYIFGDVGQSPLLKTRYDAAYFVVLVHYLNKDRLYFFREAKNFRLAPVQALLEF